MRVDNIQPHEEEFQRSGLDRENRQHLLLRNSIQIPGTDDMMNDNDAGKKSDTNRVIPESISW